MIKCNANNLEELVDVLKNNGVISVPTDTVYGLCTPINSKIGYEKLINLKQRPKNKLFPIMCSDIEQVKSICVIDKREEKLIKHFMPGPITLILKKKPDYKYIDYQTIAIRLATSSEIKRLIKLVGCPLYMTSANISNELPCTSIKQIVETFSNLDGILEGSTNYDIASTIIDCTKEDIKILREGPISKEEIDTILKKV